MKRNFFEIFSSTRLKKFFSRIFFFDFGTKFSKYFAGLGALGSIQGPFKSEQLNIAHLDKEKILAIT
jgi:hypothetical protein